jgi:hypothetical protein
MHLACSISSVITIPLVPASNGEHSPSPGYPNCPPCLSHSSTRLTNSEQLLLTLDWISLCNLRRWSLHKLNSVKIKVMLWHTVIRSFFVSVWHPSGAHDQIFITVRQLRVSWCGVTSLMRGQVCSQGVSQWCPLYEDLALQVGGGLEYLHHSPASHKRQRKGNLAPGGITRPPCFWGDINMGTWPSRLGGVSDETVKYGYGFCATQTIEWLCCKLQTLPLVRVGAPHRNKIANFSKQDSDRK